MLFKNDFLEWYHDGYDPMKLIPEKFLNSYKEKRVIKKVTEYKDYYVVIDIWIVTV